MDRTSNKIDAEIEQLGARVIELVEICTLLKNKQLRLEKENIQLKTERDRLLNKTSMVQDRVRDMIEEIKTLENQT